MTIASDANKGGPYTGNGSTTVFGYPFRIANRAHIKVLLTQASGTSALVVDADYTVSGVGDNEGGSVTVAVAPAAGQSITILRDVPFVQEIDLPNQGAMFSETIEDGLDLSVMRDQQLVERIDTGMAVALNAENILAQANAAVVVTTANADSTAADAADAAASASTAATALAAGVVSTRAAMKAVDTALIKVVDLTEAGRSGRFAFTAGDYSTHIAADTNEGVYIKADAVAATAGAWVRRFDGQNYWAKWFGGVDDYSTDNTAIINSMIVVANLQNTLSGPGTAGKQTPVRIHVEGGVKFASRNLSWLPSAGWVFVYLHYWANSDTTPGVVGYGTNEQLTLCLASGYPNDPTGGWVAEDLFAAPLHPAIGVNIQKNIDNSVAAHSQGVQRVQPSATYSAKASVAMIRDENNMVFRVAHEHYATVDEYNGTLFFVNIRRFELVVTNGGVSAGWQSSSVPVAGDVVRDITTGGRYVVTGLATSVLTTDWLSGAAVPGNTLMRERAIFKGSISGTTLTVSDAIQGAIAVGHTIVGMFANSGIPASVTIAGGSGSTWTISTSLNIAETEIVSGYLSVNSIQGGGVADLSSTNVPLQFGLDGKMYQRDTLLARFRTTLGNGAGASAGTLSNAPAAGNPTKWIPINDNGTVRYIPAW